MKRILSDITKTLLLAIVCLLGFGACGSDAPDGPTGETGETCELVVSLKAEQPVAKDRSRTRSADDPTWGEPYDPEAGLPDENAIDNVYLYLVTPDDRLLYLQATLADENDGTVRYKVTLDLNSPYITKIDDKTAKLTARLVAMANIQGLPPESPFTNYPFNIDTIEKAKRIPMWGVTSVSDLTLTVNKTVDCGQTISLLRSVPKITIQLADEIKGTYRIAEISSPWTDFEKNGYCQPLKGENVSTTTNLSREGCFNPVSGMEKGQINNFYREGASGSEISKVWFYTCERVRPAGSVPYFNVKLERTDGSGQYLDGKVFLCDYENGKPDLNSAFEGLVRNHDYQYVISLSELEFIISFREWEFGGKVHIELE